MTKEQLILSVRELISAGNTADALQSLVRFLESDKKYSRLANIALLAQAQFQETQQKIRQGIISNTDADLVLNRVRHTIFTLLDDVEKENLRPDRYEVEKDTTSKRQLTVLISILGVLVLGIVAILYFFVFKSDATNTDTGEVGEEVVEACPNFDSNSAFKVLLLPFFNYREGNLNISKSIQLRLRKLAEDYNLDVMPLVFENVELARHIDLPPKKEIAAQIAKECGSQLIIWGTEEESRDGNIFIQADYIYTGSTDKFQFTKLKLQEDGVLDTVRTVSSIALQGSFFTRPIEQIVLTFFGIIAYEQNNFDAVITELEAGNDTTFIGNLILANSYLAQQNEQKALEKYDTVIARHPHYPLARNNRGLLLYKQEKYVEAIEDFNMQLELTPKDTVALVARANAYLQTEQLEKAEHDLNAAQEIAPASPTIQRNLKSVQLQQQQKRAEIKRAETNLEANTNVVSSFTMRAEANKSLGNVNNAIEDARKAIELDPKNPQPYAILIQTYYQENKEKELQQVLELAQKNGVNKRAIEDVNATVKSILTSQRLLNATPQIRALRKN